MINPIFEKHNSIIFGSFTKNQNPTAKKKVQVPPHNISGIKRRRDFSGMRCTYVRRIEHEMKHNIGVGLFSKPSIFNKKSPSKGGAF
jgi:hypothetical protein